MKIRLLAIFCFLILQNTSSAQACVNGFSGLVKIGQSPAYTSLSAALEALKQRGLSGNVILELQPDYDARQELFPIRFPAVPCTGTDRMITVRPASTAYDIEISFG